jgi:serine/threonine protein kinase
MTPGCQENGLIEGECSIDDFDVGVTLGTGSFGRVRFATHNATGRRCAIKMLKKVAVVRNQQVGGPSRIFNIEGNRPTSKRHSLTLLILSILHDNRLDI